MLGIPMTSVLLATVVVSSSGGLDATPLVIIAVAVAYVTSERLKPRFLAGRVPKTGEPDAAGASTRRRRR
jgi:hypothetical protein